MLYANIHNWSSQVTLKLIFGYVTKFEIGWNSSKNKLSELYIFTLFGFYRTE